MRVAVALLMSVLVLWTCEPAAIAEGNPHPHRHGHRLSPWQRRHKKRQHERLAVTRRARALIGTPYVWGGSGRGGVDCSGLTRYAYQAIGRALPHLASAQARLGRYIAQRRLRPGDLLIYHGGGHVAMYLGEGRMIEASSVRGRVVVADLREGWFTSNYDQARRLIG